MTDRLFEIDTIPCVDIRPDQEKSEYLKEDIIEITAENTRPNERDKSPTSNFTLGRALMAVCMHGQDRPWPQR